MAHDHPHRDFGNPEDLRAYVQKLDDPARDEWQKPDEVLRTLGLQPGDVVGEIGAGSGYFTLRIAPCVSRVFAAEAELRMIEILRDRLEQSGARNVTPILALGDDPLFPDESCDVVLAVNAYHHFPDGPAYLRRVARALRPGGRIANIDFHEKIAREQVLADVALAGLTVVSEHGFLPQQHFLVLR